MEEDDEDVFSKIQSFDIIELELMSVGLFKFTEGSVLIEGLLFVLQAFVAHGSTVVAKL